MLLGRRPSPAALCSHLAGSLGSQGRGGCPGPWREASMFVPIGGLRASGGSPTPSGFSRRSVCRVPRLQGAGVDRPGCRLTGFE